MSSVAASSCLYLDSLYSWQRSNLANVFPNKAYSAWSALWFLLLLCCSSGDPTQLVRDTQCGDCFQVAGDAITVASISVLEARAASAGAAYCCKRTKTSDHTTFDSLCSSRQHLRAETLAASHCAVCVAKRDVCGLHPQCLCCYSFFCTVTPGRRHDSTKKGAPSLSRECRVSCFECLRAVGSLRHMLSRAQCNAAPPSCSGVIREDQIAS